MIIDVRCVPHDFFPYQANSTFHGDNKPSEHNISYVIYLIRQSQQVVVEEDGGDCHPIILVATPYSELSKRRKSMLTFIEALRIWKNKCQDRPLANWKGVHRSWPASIISFNASEDIAGECERCCSRKNAGRSLKRVSKVSRVRRECVASLSLTRNHSALPRFARRWEQIRHFASPKRSIP